MITLPLFRMNEREDESELLEILMLAQQKRSQKRRLAFECFLVIRGYIDNYRLQKAKVSKVLLEGLFDQDSPLSLLRGVCNDVVKDIIWKKVVEKWQFFPSQAE